MRGISSHPQLPGFSFLSVVIGFLVAWSSKPYYLHVGFNWVHKRGLLCPLQAGPRRTWRLCFDIVTKTFWNQRPWLCLFTDPLGVSVHVGPRELGEEEGHGSLSSQPFQTKVLCHSYQPSLAAGNFLSFGLFALFVEQDFLCGSHFFYGGALGVLREPYLGVPPYFLFSIYASGSGRHHLLQCQRAATLVLGPRVMPPRERAP